MVKDTGPGVFIVFYISRAVPLVPLSLQHDLYVHIFGNRYAHQLP